MEKRQQRLGLYFILSGVLSWFISFPIIGTTNEKSFLFGLGAVIFLFGMLFIFTGAILLVLSMMQARKGHRGDQAMIQSHHPTLQGNSPQHQLEQSSYQQGNHPYYAQGPYHSQANQPYPQGNQSQQYGPQFTPTINMSKGTGGYNHPQGNYNSQGNYNE